MKKIVGKRVCTGTMDRDFTAHVCVKENTSRECILLCKDKPGKCRMVGEM